MAFFEIKKNRKWEMVQAKDIISVNTYCKENGYKDWRMCGMMSRGELDHNKKKLQNSWLIL